MMSHDPIYSEFDEIQEENEWYDRLYSDKEDALEGWD